jgi:hypothetical protein
MLVYIIIYGIAFLAMLFDNDNLPFKTKRNILIFLVIMLTIFFGIRWDTGTDWKTYYEYFLRAKWSNIFSLSRDYGQQTLEPGFVLMMVIPKTLFNDYTFYLIVSNLLRFVLFAFVAMRLSRYPIVTFVFLVTAIMLFPTRIPYAYAFFIFGYIFIIERNLKGFLLMWALASLTHSSAMILFPVYFLYNKKIPIPVQIITYTVTLLFASQITELLASIIPALLESSDLDTTIIVDFSDKVENYTLVSTQVVEEKSTISYLVEFVSLMIANFVRFRIGDKITKEEKRDLDFFICFYFISLLFKNLFSENMYHLQRYKNYFDTLPFIVPFFLVHFRKMRVAVVIIFIAFVYYRLEKQIFQGAWSDLFIPYRMFFENF